MLGNLKAFLTIVKYAPQVLLNFRRQSTRGMSVFPFMLDFGGAILSIWQLFIDSEESGGWSAAIANPAKFALGNITLMFDVMLFFQHFYLYRGAVDDIADLYAASESDPLLSGHHIPRDSGPNEVESGR
jgi:cystinosin